MPPSPSSTTTNQDNDILLCDIENPILFQAILTRLASLLHDSEWEDVATKLARLSPRSVIVALAAGNVHTTYHLDRWLRWMMRGPNSYVDRHPFPMMREVRELRLNPVTRHCLHHFPSLHTLHLSSYNHSILPDHFYSQLQQHVTGLQHLDIGVDSMEPHELLEITQLTTLETLHIYTDNEIDLVVIPPLGALHRLTSLNLHGYGVDWEHFPLVTCDTLRGLTRLEKMQLSTLLSADVAASLPDLLPSLRYLQVSCPRLSKSARASLHSHSKSYMRGEKGFELLLTDSNDDDEEEEEEEDDDEGEEWEEIADD